MMDLPRMRFSWRWSALAAMALLLLSGCSTYEGMRLGLKKDDDGRDLPVRPTGIPYLLVRPEFTLRSKTVAGGENNATYTLAVTYEADPGQMYSIRVDPGPFADGGFEIKLAPNGNIATTSATIADQIGPTITSLGSFAKDVTSTALRGVFDRSNIRQLLIMKMSIPGECKVTSDVPIAPVPGPDGSLPPSERSVGGELASRLLLLRSDGEIAEKFHYRTSAEQLCLQATLQSAMVSRDEKKGDGTKKWETARYAYEQSDPADSEFLEKVVKTVKDQDLAALLEMGGVVKEEYRKEPGNEKPLRQSTLLTAAEALLRGSADSDLAVILGPIITMSDEVWMARQLLFLEREITRVELARLRQPAMTTAGGEKIDQYLGTLHGARARTLGVVELYERSVVLKDFLENVRLRSAKGRGAPAAAEYVAVRLELDEVLARIEARRTKMLADGKPVVVLTPAAESSAPIKRVEQVDIEASKVPGWADGPGKNADRYLFVLKEIM